MLPRRYLLLPTVPALLILLGTLGFWLIEGLTLFESLYLTVITLTTIGFGDVYPKSMPGRWFTMGLALSGVFTMFFVAAEVIRAVISGEVQRILGRRRMEQSLAALRHHLIICGYGRIGQLVCMEFAAQGLAYVVIDREEERFEDFSEPHGIPLHGDATSDDVLKQAGVERARALVTVLPTDADNLYITMSARLLNDKLFIVARAEGDAAEQKLVRAGASRVVSPYVIGGTRMAQAVLRPTVVDFIELATRTGHLDLQMEQTQIASRSRLAGLSLRDSQLRHEHGIIIVAIKKASGEMVFNPPGEAVMGPGDTLITLGSRPQLDQLEKLAGG